MDLLLHIGCEKTGTTSVQLWLDRHAAALAARGIVYSRSLGRPNNRRISFYGQEPGQRDDGLLLHGVHTAEQHAAFQQQIGAALVAEVAAARQAGARLFLISNEHCHSRLRTPVAVGRLRTLLQPLFDRIEICCFVRPQIDMCLSLASTMARNGGEVSRRWINEQMRIGQRYYRLDQLLQLWAGVFGGDRISPVAFRRNPDAVRYFAARLGVADAGFAALPASNGALDYRVIAITNAMRLHMVEGAKLNQNRRFFINELPAEQRLSLPRAWAQELQARFDPSNRQAAADWPQQLTDEDFAPDWSRYPDEGTIDRLDIGHELGPFLRAIIERMNVESWFDKARMFAANSEREAAMGEFDAAIDSCRDTIVAARHAMAAVAHRGRMEKLIELAEARIERMRLRVASAEGSDPAAPE